MIKSCVFRLPINSKKDFIQTFNLNKILENDRTCIYQNEQMRFSVDKKVIRVIIFNEDNNVFLERLRSYFYGEEYERI